MTSRGFNDLDSYINQKHYFNYTYWNERIIEVTQNNGKGKLLLFGLSAPEEGGVEENENSYNQLQEILNKTNKNVSILFSGDLNARIGNAENHNMVGSSGEPVQIPTDWK